VSDWDDYEPEDFERSSGPRAKRKVDEGYEVPNVEVVRETGAAICVRGRGLSSDPFGLSDPNEEGWVPLSQLHKRSEVRNAGDKGLLVISTWLAEKRGLV
jgi:hypothetical protein